jgi:hypothetical protein
MWAQNSVNYFSDFTNLEKIIDLSSNNFDSDFNFLTYNTCPNGVVFCNYDASLGSDSIQVLDIDVSNMAIKKSMYYIKGLSNYLLKNRCQTVDFIAKNERWMIIGMYGRFYIFNNDQSLFKLIKHSDDYQSAKFISTNELIFFTNRTKSGHNTIIDKYILPECKFEKSIFPIFKMIEYTHISGSQWFDVSSSHILFSQTVQYRINIYNQNLEFNDTIRYEGAKWKELSVEKQQEISGLKLTGIDAIRAILPYEKDISRMEQVHFFDDSTIVTYYNVPDGNTNYLDREHNFDIWQRNNNRWILKYSGYQDKYKNGLLTKSNYPIFEGKLSRKIVFSRGYLFAFMPFAPVPPFGKDKREYLKECDDYLLDNSPKPLIYIYSIKLAGNEK